MNNRMAVKYTIAFVLSNLMEQGKLNIGNEKAEELIEELRDDVAFLEKLEEFVEEYLNDFGENYNI